MVQVIDQPKAAGNYLESSGTSMFVYAMAKGVNKGYSIGAFLRTRCTATSVSSETKWRGTHKACGAWSMSCRAQAWVRLRCGQPITAAEPARSSPRGRDGSVQYYLEQPRVKDHSFGVAPFIRAGIEVENLMKKSTTSEQELGLNRLQCRSEREVLDTERQWREAWLAGDAAALDRIHADDYIAIPNIGSTSTKEQVMADVRRGVFRYSRMDTRNRACSSIEPLRSWSDVRRTKDAEETATLAARFATRESTSSATVAGRRCCRNTLGFHERWLSGIANPK